MNMNDSYFLCYFLQLSIAMIHGEEKMSESERDDGRNSPPPADVETRNTVSLGLELLPGKWKELLLDLLGKLMIEFLSLSG